jgi:hypothetical protein
VIGALKGLKVNKQGKYNNWFQPYLWPPIMATIKKYHGNRFKDFHFLQNTYRNPRCPTFMKHQENIIFINGLQVPKN